MRTPPWRRFRAATNRRWCWGASSRTASAFWWPRTPTRGLDIRTIAAIQDRLLELRAEGIGILLISSDLGEIWRLADRVLVLAGGDSFGPADLEDTSLQEVGAWMAGHA